MPAWRKRVNEYKLLKHLWLFLVKSGSSYPRLWEFFKRPLLKPFKHFWTPLFSPAWDFASWSKFLHLHICIELSDCVVEVKHQKWALSGSHSGSHSVTNKM